MRDFWISCGHHLLDRDSGRGLLVTDDFLKAYFARPELAPPADACAMECKLHAELIADPCRPVGSDEINTIADADARENWRFVLAFRDLLLRHPTLEAAYLAIVRGNTVRLPPLFVNQLTHVILRNALDGCDDPFVLRAAELFFRPQRVILEGQSLIVADEETVGGISPTPLSPLVSMLGVPAEAEVEVMTQDNAEAYWHHSDMFDMGLELAGGSRGPTALAEAMARWISHLLAVDVTIDPLSELHDAKLTWYVGLDSEATRIGDRLWNGETLDERTAGRVLGLFRLVLPDDTVIADAARGEPIYLIMAMTSDKILRMKPQNLIAGLPIKHLEVAS